MRTYINLCSKLQGKCYMVLDFDFNEKNDQKLVEFLIFLAEIQEQHDFFYTKEQLIQLKTYKVVLCGTIETYI